MREVEPKGCEICGNEILRSSVLWGLEGEKDQKKVIIILQSSDEREGTTYEQELWKSKTGRILLNVVDRNVDDIVITNAVKCLLLDRYKAPSKNIVKNCRGHLAELIDQFPGCGVLCVGSVALSAYAPEIDGRLVDYRGKVMEIDGRPCLAVGHFGRSVTREEMSLAAEFIRTLRS